MSFSATWNFNSYGLNFTNSSFFRVYAESGGTSLNFLNSKDTRKNDSIAKIDQNQALPTAVQENS